MNCYSTACRANDGAVQCQAHMVPDNGAGRLQRAPAPSDIAAGPALVPGTFVIVSPRTGLFTELCRTDCSHTTWVLLAQ